MSYIVHKAVEFGSATVKAKKDLAKRIGVLPGNVDDLSLHYMAQAKYDGVNGVAVLRGNGQVMLSRTGEEAASCDHILKYLFGRLGKDWVVLGEVWHPSRPQNLTSGDFRRKAPSPHLTFAAFDLLTLAEFTARTSKRTFRERCLKLHEKLGGSNSADPAFVAATFNPGTYGPATALAASYGSHGAWGRGHYDGLILRDPEGFWQAGSGTTGEIIKVKPRCTFDVLVVGTEEGKGKYAGSLGALVCRGKGGTRFTLSGMSDAERDQFWNEPPIGKIVEVECLGVTETGSLREPVFKGVRFDKTEADF